MDDDLRPLTEAAARWRRAEVTSDDAALVETVTGLVIGGAQEPHLLSRYREQLGAARAALGLPVSTGADYFAGWMDGLSAVVDRLRARAAPPGEASQHHAALVSMVRTRANALPVLQCIAAGHLRFGELRGETGLKDMQLHRVLVWAMRMGLITRIEPDGTPPIYQLTGTGDGVVRAVHEPAWLQTAATLARTLVRQRFLAGGDPVLDTVARAAAGATGLPGAQVRRMVEVLARALRPASASALAQALGATTRRPGAVLFSACFDDDPRWANAAFFSHVSTVAAKYEAVRMYSSCESLVMRALERAGLPPERVTEFPGAPPEEGDESDDRGLRLDQAVISLSRENPVSPALLEAYGATVQIEHDTAHIPFEAYGGDFSAPTRQHGFVLRFFHPASGTSQFVIAGGTPEGTYAASRYFYERIEKQLTVFPRQSFACVVGVERDRQGRPAPVERVVDAILTEPRPEVWLRMPSDDDAPEWDRRKILDGRRLNDRIHAGR